MAGLQLSTNTLDQTLGQAVVNLAQALGTANGLFALLNDANRLPPVQGQTGAAQGLVQAGYDLPTATLYVASYTDLANLYKVAHGQQAQPGASDFFFNARKLMGTVPLP